MWSILRHNNSGDVCVVWNVRSVALARGELRRLCYNCIWVDGRGSDSTFETSEIFNRFGSTWNMERV